MSTKTPGVLLTGATGFLGSHLLQGLLDSNKYNVVIAKRSKSDCSRIKNQLDRVKSYDVDQSNVEEIFKENQIDHVIHTAVEYGRGETTSYDILNSNLMFPISLIEAAIKYKAKSFINTDSYFNKENMAYSYLLNYSLSKKSFNLWLQYFSKQIKVINVVLEHIYGPYDNPRKFVETAIRSIAVDGVDKFDTTYGHQKRDFIFVDDVVSAYLVLLETANKEDFLIREYSLGTGEAVSLREFLEQIKSYSQSSTELRFGAIPYRDDEIMSSKAENIELRNLGWQPEFNYKKGISKICDLYKEGL